MSVVKLSQNDALMIEVLRKNGVSNEALLEALKRGDVSAFEEIEKGHFDYARLLDLARDRWADLEQAITEAYRITFNTKNGLKYLISVKFGLIADEDYVVEEEAFHGLKLSEADADWLQSTLAVNWRVVEVANEQLGLGGKTLRIELYRGQ
ncbi:MAG: hypothetical protein ACM32O_15210 [Clostridia bacterium]